METEVKIKFLMLLTVIKFSTIVQQERSAYDKIYELTSGPKSTIKSVHDTSIQILQQVGRTNYPVNVYFAAQQQELLEHSSAEHSLDDVLSKIIEHHNRMKQIGPAKCDSATVKQSDGKDSKKKGDKSATANPALKSDIESSIKCQICSLEHSAKDCPMFYELKKQSAARRGELLPGRPDKDSKRKGSKGSQELDSSEESTDKICLLCSQLKHVPDWASRNHTTQECGQLAKLNKQRGEELENPTRYRKDSSTYQRPNSQRSFTDQSQSSTMQNPYYDSSSAYSSQYPSQMPMPPQMWLSSHPMQSMSRESMGSYRSGGNSQTYRSANMTSITSPRMQQNVRDEMGEYEDTQRDARLSFTPDFRAMYPQQPSTPAL